MLRCENKSESHKSNRTITIRLIFLFLLIGMLVVGFYRQYRINTLSFYQKLDRGYDVNILVVGDSIAARTGASSKNNAFCSLQVSSNVGFANYDKEPLHAEALTYTHCRYIPKTSFSRNGNTYTIHISAEGVLGIDYSYVSGENYAEIYVDGERYATPTVSFHYDFSQRHILIVKKACVVEKMIEIQFQDTKQADGFQGLIFSWE